MAPRFTCMLCGRHFDSQEAHDLHHELEHWW